MPAPGDGWGSTFPWLEPTTMDSVEGVESVFEALSELDVTIHPSLTRYRAVRERMGEPERRVYATPVNSYNITAS